MNFSWARLHLHTQIIIVSTTILAITIIATSWLNIVREKTNSNMYLLQNALALAHNLSSNITYNIIEEKYDTIEESLINLVGFPNVESLKVVDLSGNIISHVKKSDENQPYVSYAELKDTFPLTSENNQEPIYYYTQDSLIVWYPFKSSNILGWINVSITLDEIKFQQGIIVKNNIIVALIAIVSDALILMWALSIPTRKINQAIEVAKQLDAGTPSISNKQGGSFEINKLLSLLNGLANRLADSKKIDKTNIDLTENNYKLEKLSRTDALTNIANRRYFDETLKVEIHRKSRQSTPLSLIICDIDFFKQYNDSYGHQAGDICLQQVAKSINSNFSRKSVDLVARYGGEEFAVILPNVNKKSALILAEKMRKNLESLALEHKSSPITKVVTLSIGVTTVEPDKDDSISLVIKNADDALYLAKASGRNNVKYSPSENSNSRNT